MCIYCDDTYHIELAEDVYHKLLAIIPKAGRSSSSLDLLVNSILVDYLTSSKYRNNYYRQLEYTIDDYTHDLEEVLKEISMITYMLRCIEQFSGEQSGDLTNRSASTSYLTRYAQRLLWQEESIRNQIHDSQKILAQRRIESQVEIEF